MHVCTTCSGSATSTNDGPQKNIRDTVAVATAAAAGPSPCSISSCVACASLLGIEIVPNLLQVFPGFTLFRRIAKQVGRMKRRHHLDAFVLVKTAARARNAFAYIQQVLHRRV